MLATMPAAVAKTQVAVASAEVSKAGEMSTRLSTLGYTDDPVFTAIERHRQAVQAWLAACDAASVRYDPAAEAIVDAASDRVGDALIDWLTTQPTTIAGVLATLKYAASPSPRDDERSVLSDYNLPLGQSSGYDLVMQFPAMIAAALHQIGS